MPIRTRCTACQADLETDDRHEGRPVRCPRCLRVFPAVRRAEPAACGDEIRLSVVAAGPALPPPPPPPPRACPGCGAASAAGASFCTGCGRALTDVIVVEGHVATPPPPAQPVPVTAAPPALSRPRLSGLATASLICGILSLPCFIPGLPALPAVLCGHLAHNEIAASGGAVRGRGRATAGLVLGYLNLLLAFGGLGLAAIL